MAQLPPKIPMAAGAHHWPGTGIDGHHHGVGAAAAWADEFAEFAAARRGAHRRSLSDSVAFVEVAPGAGDFDRLDDDQLMSMFPDEGGSTAPGSENGSSDSDGDKRAGKDRYGDEQNEANDQEEPVPGQATPTSSTETIRDPKRVKR
jgi:hypothetical protein